MLVSRAVFIIFLLGASLLLSCSSGEAPTEPPPVNNAPEDPSNPSPSDGATGVTFYPTLSWTCTDPDGDPLVYDVYLGTVTSPPLVSSNLTDSAYTSPGLFENTTYYWKIVARDGGGLTGESPVWSFTTTVNNAPESPSDPSPSDGATGITFFNPTLSWTCTDPDGDPLVYDVYFGTATSPPLVSSDLTDSIYTPLELFESTTYHWKIVAKDGRGLTGEGPVWSFTTMTLAMNQVSSFGSLPRWSPDGQTLLFGGEGMTIGLWVYDRISESLEQVTDDAYPHRWDYAWSPGSNEIAFGGAGPVSTTPAGIFTLTLDGSDPEQWHPTGHSPCWIPDGSGLVFSEEDPQAGIYGLFKLLFADTSLTQLTASGIDAEFNPAGTRIAYRDPGSSQAYDLRVVNADGSQMITLTDNCLRFTWTADGVTVVYDYMSYSLGMVISTVPAAGGVSSVLKTGASEPSLASTDRVAYQGVNMDLSLGIFTVNLDGSNTSQLTSSGAQPSITPDGTLIAYTREDGIWLAYP